MDLVSAVYWLLPLAVAFYFEKRAADLIVDLSRKYGVYLRRNFIGRVPISELNFIYNAINIQKIKGKIKKIIVFKKLILILLLISFALLFIFQIMPLL